MEKAACFIGHRKIYGSEALQQRIKEIVIDLIESRNVTCYIFGSRSEFNSLCHGIVTSLQCKYPQIRRIVFTCRNESAIMKENRRTNSEMLCDLLKKDVYIEDYDAEYEHRTKYESGRGNYVERNQAMVSASDFCIFYYDENHTPSRRKKSRRDVFTYQPNSGTAVAYRYAMLNNKQIINCFLSEASR